MRTADDERTLVWLERVLPLHPDLHLAPRIPADKLGRVRRLYPMGDDPVLALYDDTLFGGATVGFVITATHFGAKRTLGDMAWIELASLRPGDVVHAAGSLAVQGARLEITGMGGAALREGLSRLLQSIAAGEGPSGLGRGAYRDVPLMPVAERLEVFRARLPAHDDLHFAPAIPERKLRTVTELHGIADPGDVQLLYDDTLFGSASVGFVITRQCVGMRASLERAVLLRLASLRSSDVALDGSHITIKGYRLEITGPGSAELADGLRAALHEILAGR